MEARLNPPKSDIVIVKSEERPTPRPIRTSFSEVMARSTGSVVGGAESAMTSLPGTSMVALAVRGGAAGAAVPTMASPLGGVPLAGGLGGMGGIGGAGAAEGPGAAPQQSFGSQFLASAGAASDGGAGAALQQGEQSQLYYLQLQQAVTQQSQTYEALSNVMKSESDTVKNAIGNMH